MTVSSMLLTMTMLLPVLTAEAVACLLPPQASHFAPLVQLHAGLAGTTSSYVVNT